MTLRLLKYEYGCTRDLRSANFTPNELTGDRLSDFLKSLRPEQVPQILVIGLSENDLMDESQSLINFLNATAGKEYNVFGLVQRPTSKPLSMDDDLADNIRAAVNFQVFDPYPLFDFYTSTGTGKLIWDSTDQWAYQSHFLCAKMLSEGLKDFVERLCKHH